MASRRPGETMLTRRSFATGIGFAVRKVPVPYLRRAGTPETSFCQTDFRVSRSVSPAGEDDHSLYKNLNANRSI
jgi:hypothetical protein